MQQKRTAKYYRDILATGNIRQGLAILPEVIKRYAKDGRINLAKSDTDENFNWNHLVEGFFLSKDGGLYASVYWQGDSTDGNDSILACKVRKGGYIPARYDEIGGPRAMECVHDAIQFEDWEMEAALKAVAKWLAPDRIKARATRQIIDKIYKAVADAGKKKYDRYSDFWPHFHGWVPGRGFTTSENPGCFDYIAANVDRLAKMKIGEATDTVMAYLESL